jgi:pimeloyl-ACP methyl ester carboxylesterase
MLPATPADSPDPQPHDPRADRRSERPAEDVAPLRPAVLPPSSWTDLDGPVHYLDFGGPADGPLLVLVHGLGGSALNWAAVGPPLAVDCRVVAIDLAGFGRTRGRGRSTAVDANQRLLHLFLTEVCGWPAIVVGNSMGGLITVLQTHRHPDTVAGVVLVDPALPVGFTAPPDPLVGVTFTAYALPAIGRRLLSARRSLQSSDAATLSLLKLCCAHPDRVPTDVLDHHLALARERHGDPDVDSELLVAARSLLWVLARRRRHAAMLRDIRVPVLLLHGDADRLVPVAAARGTAAANPSWRFEVAKGVGHVPQLEAPDWTLSTILDWMAAEGAPAADLAREAAVG